MQRKKQIRILILFCLFCAVFLFSGYMLTSNMIKNKMAADAYQGLRTKVLHPQATPLISDSLPALPRISMDFSSLQEINPEIIGWIKGEGTGIDYPILQTEDNNYYLRHMYNREYNISGAIFMDYRCSCDFSDKNTVIYGHNMRNGTMFGDLEKYKDQEYYDNNPSIVLCTPQGDYLVEMISGTIENGNVEFVRLDLENDEGFLDYIDELKSRSTFTSDVDLNIDDKIVSLCTCTYDWNSARYMVIGRLVQIYQAPITIQYIVPMELM